MDIVFINVVLEVRIYFLKEQFGIQIIPVKDILKVQELIELYVREGFLLQDFNL